MPARQTLSRREFLRLAGLVAGGLTVAACAPAYDRIAGPPDPITRWPTVSPDAYRALNRLTYGPTAAELNAVAEHGLAAWIETQLAPDQIDDSDLWWRLRQFASLDQDASELAAWKPHLLGQEPSIEIVRELRQATLLRQVTSKRQLYEVLVEFWSDHFNIFIDKGDLWILKTVDDREVIRPNVLGPFRTLVGASAHSPAMLYYLDNHENIAAAPNENYARELLELHTLGVDAGYTQQDVMELARCLTGWTIKEHFWRGQFRFNPDIHDTGSKTVLGQTIPAGDEAEVEQVLDLLADHPSTAEFIAAKLVRRFIADDPPAELVRLTADTFQRTSGDLLATTRTLLLDGLVARAGLVQPKYKRPLHFVASALRALNAHTDAGPALLEILSRMGQPAFGWATPDGYPDDSRYWQGNLMPRWQFALALAGNEIESTTIDLPALLRATGVDNPASHFDQMCTLLLGAPVDSAIRDQLLNDISTAASDGALEPGLRAAVLTAGLIASPAFQYH